jgi:hypothetical protein
MRIGLKKPLASHGKILKNRLGITFRGKLRAAAAAVVNLLS